MNVYDYITEFSDQKQIVDLAPGISGSAEKGTCTSDFAASVLAVIRVETARNPQYDVCNDLGMLEGTSAKVVGDLYQILTNYPDHHSVE